MNGNLKIQNQNRISKTPKCGLYSIKNSREFVTGKSLPSPPPTLPNIPFMPIIDDTHESGVLQGFPKTILKGVEGKHTNKPADFTLQVFTISRYFKNCTQKRNILTTISL